MELVEILTIIAFSAVAIIAIKTYSATEIQKQERISEEREKKAQIYAQKEFNIAQVETTAFNSGFTDSTPADGDILSQIAPLLANPEIQKLIEPLLKPKP